MSQIVGIKFKDSGKLYYFAPNDIQLNKGDGAIVETARGVEYGTVAVPNTEVADDEIKGELKPVLRKATAADEQQRAENIAARNTSGAGYGKPPQNGYEVCRRRIYV